MTQSIESTFIMLNSALSMKLSKRMDNQLGYHGINFTEYMIMHHLENAPQKTMRRIDLAEKVGISASGVTRLIAPMEKNNIVEKEANARDARVSLVKLSTTGEQLYKDASVSFEDSAQLLSKRINANQLSKLIDLTNKLL